MSTIRTLFRATAVVAGSSAALLIGGLMGTAHADPAPVPAPDISQQLVGTAAQAPQMLQNVAGALGGQPATPPPLASASIKMPQTPVPPPTHAASAPSCHPRGGLHAPGCFVAASGHRSGSDDRDTWTRHSGVDDSGSGHDRHTGPWDSGPDVDRSGRSRAGDRPRGDAAAGAAQSAANTRAAVPAAAAGVAARRPDLAAHRRIPGQQRARLGGGPAGCCRTGGVPAGSCRTGGGPACCCRTGGACRDAKPVAVPGFRPALTERPAG
jgi:hypothetical protein